MPPRGFPVEERYPPEDRMPLRLWVLVATLTAVLFGFSQTVAFYGDEGVHLLAARLVNDGKRP